MFEPFKYLWKTISNEIQDQIIIIKEIADYYREQLNESFKTRKKMQEIKTMLQKAKNYTSWKTLAEIYDKLPVVQQNINEVYSSYYDYQYLQELVKCMNQARQDGDSMKLIQIIRSHSNRNIANCNCPFLYRNAFNHSKRLIEQYQEQLALGLETIMRAEISQLKKLQFFGQVRHAVGRTALMLSGGAIMGMYHIGVVQALIEADLMPKIIAGSSAGSIIASIIATHTRQELFAGSTFNFSAFANIKHKTLLKKIRQAGRQGCLLDIKILQQFLKDNIGQYTFQQAYDKFGVILNITVTGSGQHDADRLLNYLTAPNVLIWSASAASCAIPFIYGPTDLYCKDYQGNIIKYTLMNRKFVDGSISHDLPMHQISILFNVNNFIVSQTNPWVIPFMDYTEDLIELKNPVLQPLIILMHKIKEFVLSEVRHRASQIAYIFPNAITKFLNLLTQSYVGDVTIWPTPRFKDYLRILQNPTNYEAITTFIEGGRLRTYPKINRIKATMYMQKQIQKCYRYIRNASRLQFLASQKQIEDAGEEAYFMKSVAEEDEEDDQDQEEYLKDKIIQRPLLKKAKINYMQIQSTDNKTSKVNKKKRLHRNESFLLPRENSFN